MGGLSVDNSSTRRAKDGVGGQGEGWREGKEEWKQGCNVSEGKKGRKVGGWERKQRKKGRRGEEEEEERRTTPNGPPADCFLVLSHCPVPSEWQVAHLWACGHTPPNP